MKLSTAAKSRRLRRVANERRRHGAPPPVLRRSPCFGPCIVCNRYPKPGTKLKSAKYKLCKSCYNQKLREAKPKAKPQEEDLNVKLRRLRDRQLRQGIYPDGTCPPPLLTRAGRRTRDVPPPSPPPPDECPICLEKLDDASPSLACDHRFHAACLQELVATAWAEGAARTRARGTAVLCPCCRGQSYVK